MTLLRGALTDSSIDRMLVGRTHGLYGDCLASQGKSDEAFAQYEASVRVEPSAPMFHDRLAIALASHGQHEQAIAEWRETIRLSPTFLSARVGLADVLLIGGDAEEAAEQCREVLRQEPDSKKAGVLLGEALAAEGKNEEAIPLLEKGLEVEPRDARAHFYLGLALHSSGQPGSVVTHLNAAVSLAPDNFPMLWQAAWILATSPDSTVRDGNRAVELARRAVDLSAGQEVAPSMRSLPRWPRLAISARPSAQPSKRRRSPWITTTAR